MVMVLVMVLVIVVVMVLVLVLVSVLVLVMVMSRGEWGGYGPCQNRLHSADPNVHGMIPRDAWRPKGRGRAPARQC
jgi:hypothetical protein